MALSDDAGSHVRLRRAISAGSVEAVRARLDEGLDPNGFPSMRPPLFWAAELGFADIVELLVSRGADASRIHRGHSAATEADAHDFPALAQRLVDLGAPAASRFAHGYTPLHRAARRGDVEAMLSGLPREELDSLDAHGRTPLMLAIKTRQEPAAAALLAAGANANFCDADGFSLLCEAAYQDACPDEPTHFVARLLAAGADPNLPGSLPLLCAVNQEWSSARVLAQLVAAGSKIDARNEAGETVLHRIAELSGPEMVDAALDAGADLEARDDAGRTPLLAAAHNRNPDAFARLLERGANLSARDSRHRSILELLDASPEAAEIRARLVQAS